MKIRHDIDLQPYNTFGIAAKAKAFIPIYTENDIYEVLVENLSPLRILGGGSNILLTADIRDYVLKNEIKGIEIIDEDDSLALVQVGAGEKWHNFVLWSLSQNLAGLENLSLIPGSVGAAPMQNIGAYGVEQDSCFHSLTAIHLETGVKHIFFRNQCAFGYRDSFFKNEGKDKYIITKVKYLLRKELHTLHIEYGAIKQFLTDKEIQSPTIQDVSDAVISIRQSKLPNPKKIGNAGSFFKNPVISIALYHELLERFPNIPSYPIDETSVKVPAGWLIETIGYKGFEKNRIGVHKDQALVLVNYGGGSGNEIYELAMEIVEKVKEEYNINITPEVNVWA